MVTLFLAKTLAAELPPPPEAAGIPPLPGMEGAARDGGEEEDLPPSAAADRVVPSIEQIQDMVEKVLVETGHARTARAFILHRERRTRLREAAAARRAEEPPSLFDDRRLVVEDPAAERSAPFSADRL
ncbi:MAG: hypothetical protein HUU06_07530, partial [Planctomycetaceae bacterium]|nr:hypothetical protein [Planctomycetaceae bacterium]